MESVPYIEESDDDYFIRTFSEKTPSEELKWHFDDENRKIIPISGEGWKIQIDESLPENLVMGNEYFIPVDVYHRIIKGNGDLIIKLFKLDSTKGEQPKHVRKYIDNPNVSDNLMFHIQNGITLNENIFRYGSDAWCDLIQEAKELYKNGTIELAEEEVELIDDDAGKIIFVDDKKIILNTPFVERDNDSNEFYFVNILNNGKVEKVYFEPEK